MKFIYSTFLLVISFGLFAQEDFNLELVGSVDLLEPGNDIWGYVAPDSTEYAIIGASGSTRVYSLEDPTNPTLVISIPGQNSVWRDMKDWNDHIYVTTDQNGTSEGLLIIDMTSAPDNVSFSSWKPFIDFTDATGHNVQGQLNTCHNIYIDENGIAYLAGCGGIGNAGVILLDLNQDPKNPVVIGVEDDFYAHDAYTRGDTLYASEISANPGQLTLYDVSQKDSIISMGSVITSFEFCHNTWISDDGKYAFTTDERANAFVDSYDITDPMNMVRLDQFQPLETAGNDVIPHNTHYKDGYLITSWYTDGVVITDVSNPDIMVEVGHYDSYLGPHGDFNGCWGAYPWLPSGLILASNITGNDNQGTLLILQPTYERASFLRGTVTDADTGAPINGVSVEILDSRPNEASTDAVGVYGTGVFDDGTIDVRFEHPDYVNQTKQTLILSGQTTVLNAQLVRLAQYQVTGNTVRSSDTNVAVPNSSLIFISDEHRFEITTDSDGTFSEPITVGTYDVYAGAWGFLHKLVEDVVVENAVNITIELDRGYQDDFIFDLGWTVSGNAETGHWVREEPIQTVLQGNIFNPGMDIDNDFGTLCYVTENSTGGVGAADVDDGQTILTSDVMDLTWYQGPQVEYTSWFANGGGQGSPANDSLNIFIDNGSEVVMLESLTGYAGAWRPESSFFLPDYIEITDNMRMIVATADFDQGHLVEAGFDGFFVKEGQPSSVNNIEGLNEFKVLPNPFNDNLRLNIDSERDNKFELRLVNVNGQTVLKQLVSNNGAIELNTENLESGAYFIQLSDGKSTVYKKLIKQ